jgi:hypothetical protein
VPTLYGAGAQYERRGRGSTVGHPAGGDYRNPHRIDELRQ